jgi:hypothetical protein
VAAAAHPGLLVVPLWYPGGDDRLRVITAGEGLLHLTRSALNFGSQRERSIDHLASLAAAAPAFSLRWRDPHAAAATILRQLGCTPP